MPARSKSQQRLFGAAYGGATFPEAQRLRDTMTTQQLKDFASTPRSFLPNRVSNSSSSNSTPRPRAPRASVSMAPPRTPRISMPGMNTTRAPQLSMPQPRASTQFPHINLGNYLHAKKR